MKATKREAESERETVQAAHTSFAFLPTFYAELEL